MGPSRCMEDEVMQYSSDDTGDVPMNPCHEESSPIPPLDAISETEDYSCGSFNSSTTQSTEKSSVCRKSSFLQRKRVSWDRIHTREFALVVGDHPLCQDGLPVSLDWQHTDRNAESLVNQALKVSERTNSYAFPKRLSYEERRQRLCFVSGLSEDQVKHDEIDLVLRTLQESWESVSTNPADFSVSLPFDPTPIADGNDNMDTHMINVWDDDVINQDVDLDLGDITDFEWTD